MSDLYLEELVVKKRTGKDKAISIGLLVLTFFLWFETYIWFGSLIFLIPAFALTVFDFYFLPKLNVEWEYTYTSAELDIDKIFNRAKRKRIGTYEIKTAEIIAPVNSHRLDYYNNNKKMKLVDCSSLYPERANKVYAMIIEGKKNELLKVLFEPTEEMIKDMRMRAPQAVFFD